MSLTNLKPNATPAAIADAHGRDVREIPYDLVRIVDQCDQLLRRHGMQMQILCETCYHAGSPAPYVQGDNPRGGAQFEMVCGCTRRMYRLVS